jgi:hypothetical protein
VVRVTPARGLQWGQRVGVAVSNFPVGAKVWLSECAGGSDVNPIGCGGQLARQPFLLTNADGAGQGGFTLRSLAATGPLRPANVPCRYTCVLVATAGAVSKPVVAVAPLRFAPPTSAVGIARLQVRPAAGLRDGQRRPEGHQVSSWREGLVLRVCSPATTDS